MKLSDDKIWHDDEQEFDDDSMITPDNSVCLIDGALGIYIPNEFAKRFGHLLPRTQAANLAILLEGPDAESYDDAFEEILADVTITIHGIEYMLHQEGDLFGVMKNHM